MHSILEAVSATDQLESLTAVCAREHGANESEAAHHGLKAEAVRVDHVLMLANGLAFRPFPRLGIAGAVR